MGTSVQVCMCEHVRVGESVLGTLENNDKCMGSKIGGDCLARKR